MFGQHPGFWGHYDPRFGDRERGRGGHPRWFGPHGPWHSGFEMLRERGSAREGQAADFAGGPEEGDGEMRGDMGEGRGGGPRGRGFGFGWGFGFGPGPGRGERPLEQGDLRWLVLDLIAAQPRHGYELIKAIEEMFGGHYTPSPGVVYPTLTYLEETGLIASETQATKKLYTLTEEGRAALDSQAAALGALRARIEQARGRFGGPPAPEMKRAMDNLRAAISVRLAKGPLSPESLALVTAALDRAAGEIERS